MAARNKELIQEELQKKVEEQLSLAAETARTEGIPLPKLIELLTIFYMEE